MQFTKTKRNGVDCFVSPFCRVETDRGEEGFGEVVSRDATGTGKEWIIYSEQGALLEGNVIKYEEVKHEQGE